MPSPTTPNPSISLPVPPDPETGLPFPPGEDRLSSFFSADGVSRALEACDFSREELVSRLVALSRDSDPKIAAKGLSQLTSYLNSTARFSGLIGKAKVEKTITRDADGNILSASSHSVEATHRVSGALSRGRPLPAAANRGQEFIPAQIASASPAPSGPGLPPPGQVD